MASARDTHGGLLIAGVWVMGIGAAFLIRDLAGWSWGEAWPLFVILVGAAGLVSQLVAGSDGPGLWGTVWPLVIGAVGVLLLLSTTGQLAISTGELVAQGWPWFLVAAGIWNLVAAFWPGGTRPNPSEPMPPTPPQPPDAPPAADAPPPTV